MELWLMWWEIVRQLRPAVSHLQTYLWLCTCLAGMTIRRDKAGVTSYVRSLGLCGWCYDRMLDCFHSSAVDREHLARLWTSIVLGLGACHIINGRILLIGDGVKAPKEGKKMPAVKCLHQESDSNSKPEYIMGHSCQALAVCCQALSGFFAVPLVVRIHEGIVLSNRDERTLMDKMSELISSLAITVPLYFLGDSYYACSKIVDSLIAQSNHIVTRIRSNAVAFIPASRPRTPRRGRPKVYGDKVRLKDEFQQRDAFKKAPSPDPSERGVTILYRSLDLLWRPVARVVRFVLVIHPVHGNTIYMTTDLSLHALQVLAAYTLRFKIEISFRQAIHTIGTFAYHFWMKAMAPIRRYSGNQYLHRKTEDYRAAVARKINAYHLHLQLGAIAHGILNHIAASAPDLVWRNFSSWIRTIRPGLPPSEMVTAMALRNSYHEFLADTHSAAPLAKFIAEKIDTAQAAPLRLCA